MRKRKERVRRSARLLPVRCPFCRTSVHYGQFHVFGRRCLDDDESSRPASHTIIWLRVADQVVPILTRANDGFTPRKLRKR